MKVNYQIYDHGDEVLLAACDNEVLGRTLKDGDINLKVKESFYAGQKIEIEALKRKFQTSTIANLVGEKVVDAAIESGFGQEEDIMIIEGVPHLQIVRL
ncbi:MAG: DUF424 family protein [Candidatus Thermoplasmatota archaeon]|nr:DUF424 family protein [Candidatus Thermoplasmatota archaeon]MBS3789330.1 DUF424 family protein [Candidatus Thermoplasmatota archaeon]